MKLSIIIPLYNAERYIERCLRSCVDQDLDASEYEIIVVNDGTPDNSMEIVERLAAEAINIRIFEQENSGPGAARNCGIDHAKGKYVWFVDSDDWIESECLEELTRRLSDEDLDALIILASVNDDSRRSDKPLFDLSALGNKVYSGRKIVYRMAVCLYPQVTIYRRSVLVDNEVRFMPKIYHEDNEFIPRAYYHLERVSVWHREIYNLYMSPMSITRTINPKRSYDLLTVSRSLAIFANKVEKSYLRHLYKCIAISLNTSMLCATEYDDEQRREFSSVLKHNKILFSYFFLSGRIVFMVEGVLFSLFPGYALKIYEVFNRLIYKHKA